MEGQMEMIMGADARSAWAWSVYDTNYPRVEVSADVAQAILDAIPEGDHVEAMAPGFLKAGTGSSLFDSKLHKVKLSDATHICARTTRRWIFVPLEGGQAANYGWRGLGWYGDDRYLGA